MMRIAKITLVTAQGVDVCEVNGYAPHPYGDEKITHIEEETKQVSESVRISVYRAYVGDKMVREISALCPTDITYVHIENK